jgi:hypothetical protein
MDARTVSVFRLLVCGGRDYEDRDAAFRALDAADAQRRITTIIHGGANGADKFAGEWAAMRGRECVVYRADWEARGRAAGPERNARMLSEGKPQGVLALPGGRGTLDMVRKARAFGLPVWEPYRARDRVRSTSTEGAGPKGEEPGPKDAPKALESGRRVTNGGV